jgi:hypothetical protein
MQVTVSSISLYAQQKIAAELLKQGTKHQLMKSCVDSHVTIIL